MKTRRSTILVGVLAAGLVLTQQACTSASPPVAAPSSAAPSDSAPAPSSPSPSPSASSSVKSTGDSGSAGGGSKAGKSAILAGKRQVVIKPNPSFESIVAVDDKGRLSLIDGEAEHTLFVFTPVGGKYQIKTAKATSGGEPDCMGIKTNGTASLTVVATACDASRGGQLFTITEQKKKDSEGDPTYAISNEGAFLQERRSGLIAEELGDSPLATTFSFVDNGPSTLPILD